MSSRENFTGQRSRGGAFPAEGRTRTKAWKQEQASCGQAPESLPARMASRYGAQRERAEPGGVGKIIGDNKTQGFVDVPTFEDGVMTRNLISAALIFPCWGSLY